MRRARITITLNNKLIDDIDRLIDGKKIRNRSHAIEYGLSQFFQTKVQKAVILAGGVGTKLRPYTYEIPKSLLPIKGRPILEYLIEGLKKNNIFDLIICIGYLGEKIKQYFGNGQRFGVRINYNQEKHPLQTGGVLNSVKKLLDNQPFLLVYGDILTNFSFKDLVAFHQKEKSIATMALTTVNRPESFGQLALHGTRVVRFFQKTKKTAIKSHLVNSGIYVFEPEVFNYFPKNKKNFLLEKIIEKLIIQKKVSGFVFEEQWFDVGDPKNYEKAIKEFKEYPDLFRK